MLPPDVLLGSVLGLGISRLMISMASRSALKHNYAVSNERINTVSEHSGGISHSLGLSWMSVAAVRLGLHGVSALSDQTLPPG